MTAAEVEARIEEEKQKVAAELAQKHKQHVETMEQIHKMRQELKVQTKEREIQNLKDLLAGAGVTVGTTGSNDTRPANASTEVQTRAPAPTGALSVSAPTFRPQAAATTPARPARPANPVRVVRTTPGAPGSPSEAGPAARNLSGAAPRPGHAATNAHGHHPRPAAGHSRLRPPLGARVAAAAATATGTSPAVQPSAVTATSTAAPASAQAVTPQTAATVTATSAPVPTSAPASTPASVQPSRLLIKRRREEELPGDLNHPQSTSPSLDATAVEGGSVTGSPSMGPTSVIVTPDSKTPPMVIKRQRQLPVVVSATTSTQETSTSVPAASETKSGTVTIQRRRVISTTDSTEAQPGSAPASTPDVTVTTTPPTSAAAEPTAKTSPHGQKRRLETTETVQESITIVSTPGPTDVEEDVSTPEPSHENMSMEVDDAPPVKRVRPSSTGGSSSVVITELPDEAPSSSNAQEELAAPEQFLDYEEGEMEDEAANANVDVATAETAGAEPAQKEEQQEEDHHTQEETVQQGSGADHEVEDELEGLDSTYETPGATDVIVFEDVEVQAPHAQDDEEVELELGLDEQREHEGEGDGSESAA
ncbi:hypothetical protein BC939DRAFT_316424 [Gamsiella multidivaricata]|uniref:uncharacterized protein n=1 Tax=Gamsiella multidivaricata TaxID=101098 RepID=UPI0022208DFC|nr:uncharacterized protein BC939DRAFT_316424 [Gamsiella multidivaricata]KAI7817780.1 hypothetical protein BC939DRAFT_316424 [Gamsiella multidivaricata]